jgi:hypothetical protein
LLIPNSLPESSIYALSNLKNLLEISWMDLVIGTVHHEGSALRLLNHHTIPAASIEGFRARQFARAGQRADLAAAIEIRWTCLFIVLLYWRMLN